MYKEEQLAAMRITRRGNHGYGHAKQALFELICETFKTEREKYTTTSTTSRSRLKIGAKSIVSC
jgi:tryptophanyl-tRNA synthetase